MECSRLAVDRRFRAREALRGFNVTDLVVKGVYRCCLAHGHRHLAIVVSTTVLKYLCSRGIPCVAAGEPVTMPDGVQAVAALLDWDQVTHHPDERLRAWYGEVRYIRDSRRGQPLGSDSQPQAF
jgi:N-acyl-L-homoserine lactone synthetase